MGASKQKSYTNQKSDPWAPAQPLLNQQIGGISSWLGSGQGSQVYGGQRVADFNPSLQGGVDHLAGSTGARASSSYLQDVLAGKYLNNNPYQDALDASIRSAVMPSLNAQFSNAGMSGSTLHQGMLGKALAEALAAPRYQNYQNERGAMGQAAGLLPGIDQSIGENMLRAGGIRQAHEQDVLNASQQQFNEQRDAGIRPYLMTGDLSRGIASLGGQQVGSSTSSTNPGIGQQILGAGMMGASLLGGGPMYGGFGAGVQGLINGGPTGAAQGYAGMNNPAFWQSGQTVMPSLW